MNAHKGSSQLEAEKENRLLFREQWVLQIHDGALKDRSNQEPNYEFKMAAPIKGWPCWKTASTEDLKMGSRASMATRVTPRSRKNVTELQNVNLQYPVVLNGRGPSGKRS